MKTLHKSAVSFRAHNSYRVQAGGLTTSVREIFNRTVLRHVFVKQIVSSPLLVLTGVMLITALVSPSVAHADDDPLQFKPNLMWLSSDVNVSVFDDSEYDSFLGKSEVWGKNWGVSAKLLQNDSEDVFGLPADSQYFNFDVKRRVLGKQNRSNLELGLGWQEFDIDSQLDASGPKLSLSGRFNFFKSFQVYGETAYFPELEDEIQNSELRAFELEAGLLYQPLPSWSFKAGYRVFSLDLDDAALEELGSSSGFLLGTDLSW